MKLSKIPNLSYILIFLFLVIEMHQLSAQNKESGTLRIQIEHIKEAKGTIYLALYLHAKDFGNPSKAFFTKIQEVKSSSIDLYCPNIPHGWVAVAIFHDLNNNQKLDKNFVGYPLEPFGFSKNPGLLLAAPHFDETKIWFNKEVKSTKIILRT